MPVPQNGSTVHRGQLAIPAAWRSPAESAELTFNERDHQRFQARETEAFRGTLMVAALSYGFNTDVRPTFRRLRFPVDDSIYRELIGRMPEGVNFVP